MYPQGVHASGERSVAGGRIQSIAAFDRLHRTIRRALVLLVLFPTALVRADRAMALAEFGIVYTVNSNNDVNDGSCNAVHCSFREAICAANLAEGTDTIHFSIGSGPQTITPNSALPTVEQTTVIDATTQPGYAGIPLITLDGVSVEGESEPCNMDEPQPDEGPPVGLKLTGGSTTVRGFCDHPVQRRRHRDARQSEQSDREQLHRDRTQRRAARGTSATESRLKIPPTIASAERPPVPGMSSPTTAIPKGVGGVSRSSERNHREPSLRETSSGTNRAGSAAIGNASCGVCINGAPATRVGGDTAAARNLISGNGGHGIAIESLGAEETVIEGNFIGTTADGSAALPNGSAGIFIHGAAKTTVGGFTPSTRNLISGNISYGIEIVQAPSTIIRGSHIGTGVSGMGAIGNGAGILVEDSPDVTIGGSAASLRNVISGNGSIFEGGSGDGIDIFGAASTKVTVQGNYIGLNAAGTDALGNGGSGIVVEGASGITIGDTTADGRNVISGNGGHGILIGSDDEDDENDESSFVCVLPITGTVVLGNYIGTDANGTADLGNAGSGVVLAVDERFAGDTTVGPQNVISGNGADGVTINAHICGTIVTSEGSSEELDCQQRARKFHRHGRRRSGTARQRRVGRSDRGAHNNVVGGTDVADRNIISANGESGIDVRSTAFGNAIKGNFIGTNVIGTGALG